ncbi:MAG: hypothetical protein ACOH2K_00290 [Burkholderiaceae bacterium]
MSSEIPRFYFEPPDMVFSKTPKGRNEVEQRSMRLNGKQRSILIMIDGQKRLSAISTLISDQEVASIADILLEFELIAPQTEAAVTAVAPRTATVDRTLTSSCAQTADSTKLFRIKAMMTLSAETYLGLMAASVVRRVEQACDEAQLLSVVGHWHMAMHDSKYGKDVANMHLEQIKASFAART